MGYFLLGLLLYFSSILCAFMARALGHFLIARRRHLAIERWVIGAGATLFEKRLGVSGPLVELRAFPFVVRLVLPALRRDLAKNAGRAAYRWRATTGWRVMLAGLGSMYALAFVGAFVIAFAAGKATTTPPEATTTVDVTPESPAALAGMRNGDRIVAVRGIEYTTWAEIRSAVRAAEGGTVGITVERAGERIPMAVTPVLNGDGQWIIGSTPRGTPPRSWEAPPLLSTTIMAVEAPWHMLLLHFKKASSQPAKMYLFARPADSESLALRITSMTTPITCNWLVFLSLPLPGLDGLRFLAFVYEAVSSNKLGKRAWERIESRTLLFWVWLGLVVLVVGAGSFLV